LVLTGDGGNVRTRQTTVRRGRDIESKRSGRAGRFNSARDDVKGVRRSRGKKPRRTVTIAHGKGYSEGWGPGTWRKAREHR